MKIGILAVQGDFDAHAAMLRELAAETVEVRTVADIEECKGLIRFNSSGVTGLPSKLQHPNWALIAILCLSRSS